MQILFEDPHLLVVSKPAGLLAVPGRGADKQDCLVHRLQASHPGALIVHRLDQATSGLMVLARSPQMQRQLSASFRDRTVHKRYIAVVHGLAQADSGEIDLPLATDWPNRPRQQVDMAGGKPSQTHWQVLQRDLSLQRTRLCLEPLTGRTHQLRVHLLAVGHAIVGDTLYGPSAGTAAAPLAPHTPTRMMLHASELGFSHPVHGGWLQNEEPAPF